MLVAKSEQLGEIEFNGQITGFYATLEVLMLDGCNEEIWQAWTTEGALLADGNGLYGIVRRVSNNPQWTVKSLTTLGEYYRDYWTAGKRTF